MPASKMSKIVRMNPNASKIIKVDPGIMRSPTSAHTKSVVLELQTPRFKPPNRQKKKPGDTDGKRHPEAHTKSHKIQACTAKCISLCSQVPQDRPEAPEEAPSLPNDRFGHQRCSQECQDDYKVLEHWGIHDLLFPHMTLDMRG